MNFWKNEGCKNICYTQNHRRTSMNKDYTNKNMAINYNKRNSYKVASPCLYVMTFNFLLKVNMRKENYIIICFVRKPERKKYLLS